MIRPLRRIHRAGWIILAAIVALGFVAGLRARKPPAVMEQLPADLRP